GPRWVPRAIIGSVAGRQAGRTPSPRESGRRCGGALVDLESDSAPSEGRAGQAGGMAASGQSNGDPAKPTGTAIFRTLWDGLVDVLGTAATAVILGRAARRALVRSPELG